MKDIICFLCVNPSAELLEFAKQLYSERYDVYIAVDNENAQLPDKQPIRFINISRREAESMGYKNTLEFWRGKFIGSAAARDKALYYFTYKRVDYQHIWLIEDDVFIPSVKTIASIDEKYPRTDLLCASNYIKNEGEQLDWLWPLIAKTAKYVFPMACSMICAIRVSRELMRCIQSYAEQHHNLFADEALFNTVSLKNNLTTLTIPELSGIVYRHSWKLSDINITHLYHPVKSQPLHKEWRGHLN